MARRAWWVVLAFVPSSLMLGVTQFISTDLAAVPLLWVVPLLLYLVTFMLSFAQSVRVPARFLGRATPLVVAVLAMVMLSYAREPVLVVITVHIVAFFVLAWMCHKRLSDDRPDPAHLTEFYLLMSVGGVLGGIFNALLAPNLFNSVAEYPLVIALACFLTPQCAQELRRLRDRWHTARAATGPSSGRARALALALLLTIPLTFLALHAYLTVIDDLAALGAIRTSRLQSALLGGVPVALCLIALLWHGTPRFAAGILAAMILFPGLGIRDDAFVIRTFFGVHRVTIRNQPSISVAELHHGTTLHGVQFRTDLVTGQRPPILTPDERNALFYAPRAGLDPVALLARRARYQLLPTTYYHPTGPIGDVMRMLADTNRLDSAAFIGMGTGTLAAYAQPGSTFIFFEIDPAVVDIANDPNHFSYIADAMRIPGVRIGTVLGDGRRTIVDNTDLGPYRAIVIDAFSSDAIPVHLVTKEAVEGYVSRLTPDGVLAFHISNRYFDLSPVLARLALELNLVAFIRNDPFEIAEEQKRDSLWVVMARAPEHLAPLTSRNPLWERMGSDTKDPLWTDEYSNVLRVFVPLRPLFDGDANARPTPPAPAAPRPLPTPTPTPTPAP
jgi:spermidine synthase